MMLARIELDARTQIHGNGDEKCALTEIMKREFRCLEIAWCTAGTTPGFVIDVNRWQSADLCFVPLDEALERALAGGMRVLRVPQAGSAESTARVALEAITRWQRYVELRNAASSSSAFDDLLARHAALHDRSKPLVRADHDHAVDVWRWVLRLQPTASIELQAAALLHDVERLESEPDVRIEHRAPDYGKFKDAHAARGAETARELCAPVLGDPSAWRVAELVARHETRAHDEELLLLNDADALSFFSLNSSGFLDYYGPAHTARKVLYTLDRMRPSARRRLRAGIRLRREIEALIPLETMEA
jgi:hypothetical protein